MKRTTIMLPDHLHALLDRERRRRDTSAAAVVREALEAYLTEDLRPKRFAFIGVGQSGGGESIGQEAEEILDREWATAIEDDSGLRRREPAANERPTWDSGVNPPTDDPTWDGDAGGR